MRLVAALSCAVLLAGCGGGSDTASSPSPTSEWAREEAEWYLVSISDETLELVYTMSGVASNCQREGGVEVEESTDRVAVVAHREVNRNADVCTEELAIVEETIELSEPLGDRALVGCRPGRVDPSEDETCRDLERSEGYRGPEPLPGEELPTPAVITPVPEEDVAPRY